MCLGSGGMMMQPQQQKPAPPPRPGQPSPDDSVNNQPVPNAKDRANQEANRNKYDPDVKSKPTY